MTTKKLQKDAQYFCCENCDYTTSRKSSYSKHILSTKHFKTTNILHETIENNVLLKEYICENCNNKYKHHSSLWKHKKTCIGENNSEKDEEENQIINFDKEMFTEFIKQNQSFQKELYLDMQQQMFEFMKNNSIMTNSNNTNCNNKTFNLNVFLNETCKDAMNIMDFVDSIKIQLEDLEDVGKLGYINGISNIIMKNLKALDITKRPVHCSDSKRETLYVKDQDKWEKEDQSNTRLRKAIKRVAYKNTKVIRDWRDIHPDHDNSFSKTSDIYQQIVIESMGGKYYETTDTEAKIIKNIAKHVVIDK